MIKAQKAIQKLSTVQLDQRNSMDYSHSTHTSSYPDTPGLAAGICLCMDYSILLGNIKAQSVLSRVEEFRYRIFGSTELAEVWP